MEARAIRVNCGECCNLCRGGMLNLMSAMHEEVLTSQENTGNGLDKLQCLGKQDKLLSIVPHEDAGPRLVSQLW